MCVLGLTAVNGAIIGIDAIAGPVRVRSVAAEACLTAVPGYGGTTKDQRGRRVTVARRR